MLRRRRIKYYLQKSKFKRITDCVTWKWLFYGRSIFLVIFDLLSADCKQQVRNVAPIIIINHSNRVYRSISKWNFKVFAWKLNLFRERCVFKICDRAKWAHVSTVKCAWAIEHIKSSLRCSESICRNQKTDLTVAKSQNLKLKINKLTIFMSSRHSTHTEREIVRIEHVSPTQHKYVVCV